MYANAVLTGAIFTAFVLPFVASAPIQAEVETRVVKEFKPLHTRNVIEKRDDDTFYSGDTKRDDNTF
ncbi:hypothetical protein GGI35DRAFT_484479 [Trichoderma velutinum]